MITVRLQSVALGTHRAERCRPGRLGAGGGMIDRLVIFGATGDLTARFLLPGLAALRKAGLLDGQFSVTGSGREDWDSERFRFWADEQLRRHAQHFGPVGEER